MVTLGVVDSHLQEFLQSGFILDAFGDRLDLELLGDPDDRADDLLVLRVGEQISDELDVDLQVVDGKMPEVGERSVTDAKVIECEGAAELAQMLCERPALQGGSRPPRFR